MFIKQKNKGTEREKKKHEKINPQVLAPGEIVSCSILFPCPIIIKTNDPICPMRVLNIRHFLPLCPSSSLFLIYIRRRLLDRFHALRTAVSMRCASMRIII